MKILFLVKESRLDPNFGGENSRVCQNLASLCELGHEVHLLKVALGGETGEPEKKQAEIEQWLYKSVASINDLTFEKIPSSKWRDAVWSRFGLSKWFFRNIRSIAESLRKKIVSFEPEIIWVEGYELAQTLFFCRVQTPWIYSQYDIFIELRKKRHGKISVYEKIWAALAASLERQVLQRAAGIVSGSALECEKIQKITRKPNVYWLPHGAVERPNPILEYDVKNHETHIVHLGSLSTTANRIGLQNYLDHIHPLVEKAAATMNHRLRFSIVGSCQNIPSQMRKRLEEVKAKMHGFVYDLNEVVQPFDLAIVPYHLDSGYRTKMPKLFEYGLAIVARQEALGREAKVLNCYCSLANSNKSFADAVIELIRDPQKRKTMGTASYAAYSELWSYKAHIDKYEKLLQGMA